MHTLMNDLFLKACRREPVSRTPVWFMRQAGRYMQEYQKIRANHSILDVCKTPELAAEVTLQPINRFSLDAAIIFADILLPLEPMGLQLTFVEDKGPVIRNPIRDEAAINQLRMVGGEAFPFTDKAIRLARKSLEGRVPLIGFAGAPFTLASYAIEGGSSRSYIHTKALMYSKPDLWKRLMEKFVAVLMEYLRVQIQAGAQAIQIFDSWVGSLSPGDFREYALPYVRHIFHLLKKEGIPLIYFGTGTATLLSSMKDIGCDVIGLDWHVNLDEAWGILGDQVAVQGNMDPVLLYAPIPEIERRVKDILNRAGNKPGHIFNLGHGILPQTPVDHVEATIAIVKKLSQREA